MMRKILIILAILLASGVAALAKEISGVHFEQDSSWQEVLSKAKAEHKHIFVDCYATWCGPCKHMDETVYSVKEVGDAYNSKFISVRLQMDRTKQDTGLVKKWYKTAERFTEDYHIGAYPTFLFFDENGKPLHKVTGVLEPVGFIQLASDATNPEKQYYRVLTDFRPGELDTAEEKGLIHAFMYADKELAGKIAADYLSRTPKADLGQQDKGRMMSDFKENPQVFAIAVRYLKGLNRAGFAKNVAFVRALINKHEIRQLALNYLNRTDTKEYVQPYIVDLLCEFRDDSLIAKRVNIYIDRLPERRLLIKGNLYLETSFMHKSSDRAFKLFYDHTQDVNSNIGGDVPYFAQRIIANIISKEMLMPKLKAAKADGTRPDFTVIGDEIAKKYNRYYADWVTGDGKLNWYEYLIKKKDQPQYWPQFIDTHVKQIVEFGYDTLRNEGGWNKINNMCYNEIFLHGNDTTQFAAAIRWMKQVVDQVRNSSDFMYYMDTYACVLYKAGKTDDAIDAEEQLLKFCAENRKKGTYHTMLHTTEAIREMWSGQKIWLEKEFQ